MSESTLEEDLIQKVEGWKVLGHEGIFRTRASAVEHLRQARARGKLVKALSDFAGLGPSEAQRTADALVKHKENVVSLLRDFA